MEGTCGCNVQTEAALNSKPGGQNFCFCQKYKINNLKHKEQTQNKMIYSQIPGLERVGKLPDTAQRGQVAHHGFNPCFVLQREEMQIKTAAGNTQGQQFHITSGHIRIVKNSYGKLS